jgi:DNA-binding XRE family transcriptional regulator
LQKTVDIAAVIRMITDMARCFELLVRREGAKLTQAALANRAGVNKETVVRLERGQFKRGPGALTMSRIAHALGATVDEVFPELMTHAEKVA